MKDHDKNKESSYINYWNVNKLYGWTMFQKLSTFSFEWVEDISQFTEGFIKNYDEKSEVGCILKVYVQYPIKLYELHSYLAFLPERKKLWEVEKLVTSLQDKSE